MEGAGRGPIRDPKEAGVQNCHLSESEPLVGTYGRARRRRPPKPGIFPVTRGCTEGRWAMK